MKWRLDSVASDLEHDNVQNQGLCIECSRPSVFRPYSDCQNVEYLVIHLYQTQ